jgi:hypothetical protein
VINRLSILFFRKKVGDKIQLIFMHTSRVVIEKFRSKHISLHSILRQAASIGRVWIGTSPCIRVDMSA